MCSSACHSPTSDVTFEWPNTRSAYSSISFVVWTSLYSILYIAKCNHMLCVKTLFDANRLTLYLGKTKCFVFHADNHISKTLCYEWHSVPKTNCVKYLGLLIHDQLCCKQHNYDLCNNLVKCNGIFYHLKASLTHSLVASKLSHGAEMYGTTKPYLLKPLHVLQIEF